jgi:hypothetical protein
MSFSPPGRGRGHYGNVAGMTVKVQPDGSWAVARGFVNDPTPGAA